MQTKKILTIILIIIALLAVSVVGYYSGKKEKNIPEINNQISELPQNITEISKELKEYKNDELGISFMYPEICGEMKIRQDQYTISIVPTTNLDYCSIKHIEVSIKEYDQNYEDEEGFESCGQPGRFDENNIPDMNGLYFDYTRSGVIYTYIFSLGYPDVCGPIFGEMYATFNLKHGGEAIGITGSISESFRKVLTSFNVY